MRDACKWGDEMMEVAGAAVLRSALGVRNPDLAQPLLIRCCSAVRPWGHARTLTFSLSPFPYFLVPLSPHPSVFCDWFFPSNMRNSSLLSVSQVVVGLAWDLESWRLLIRWAMDEIMREGQRQRERECERKDYRSAPQLCESAVWQFSSLSLSSELF